MPTKVREWTPDMGEISGMGGSYEVACRAMLEAALRWLEEHPSADPKFHGFHGVYGVLAEDNDDAKALSAAAVTAAESLGGATGAMHQAVISHALWIKTHSWEEWCEQKRTHHKKRLH